MARLAVSLFLFAAFAAGVIHFGAPVVATGSTGDAAAAARTGGSGRWGLSHGPEGGPAFALAVAPSAPKIVYVGTGRGVFRSMNGGQSWASAGLAQPPGPDRSSPLGVTSLAVDPRAPRTVYAGLNGRWDGRTTFRQPVYKSTNGGRTWRALALRGRQVAISPTGPPTVYAAAGGPGGTSRLFRSTNGGRSWQAADHGLPSTADRGLPSRYLWALAFDPTSRATVYAAMGPHGVFKSSDRGGSWHTLGVSPAYREVTAITVDPQQPQTLYAGTDAGVIKSLDGGRSWRLVNAALCACHGRDRWYGQVSALVVDSRDSRSVYASTVCTGVFKSTDGGHRWSPANAGLEPACGRAYSLALDPLASQSIYAADSARGVLKSLDGGAHWHAANTGLSLSTVFSLALDTRSPPTIYAGVGGLGLFKSSDGGAHWQSLASGPKLVHEVAIDSSSPRSLLAVASGYGVVRSTDAGRTWAQARLGAGARWVAVLAISGKAAYAGGRSLFRSTDGGRSWRALRSPGLSRVQALAISPANAAVAYAATFGVDRGLYKTTDGGNSWQRLTDALDTDVNAIALDPTNPATIYIGIPGGEGSVFKSTDGGSSWQPAGLGLPPDGVTDLAIDPVHPATLYAAVDGRGVFRSTDSGQSWQSLNAGLTVHDVWTLGLDATGRTLYAGTAGGGVVSLHPKA